MHFGIAIYTFSSVLFLNSSAISKYHAKYGIYPITSLSYLSSYKTKDAQKYLQQNTKKYSPDELYARLSLSILLKLSDKSNNKGEMSLKDKNNHLLANYTKIESKYPRLKYSFGFLDDLKTIYLDSENYEKYEAIYNKILKLHKDKISGDMFCYKFSHSVFLPSSKFEYLEKLYKKCKKSNSIEYVKNRSTEQFNVLKINKKPFKSNLAYQKEHLESLKNK